MGAAWTGPLSRGCDHYGEGPLDHPRRCIVTREASLWGDHWDLYSHPGRWFSWDYAESSMSPLRALSLMDVRLCTEGPGTRCWRSYPESLFGRVNFLQSQLSGNKVRTGRSSRKMSSKSSSSSAAGTGAGRGLLRISPTAILPPPLSTAHPAP